MTTIWNDTFESIHLPNVPRYDVGYILEGFELWFFTELGSVIVDESVEQGFAGENKVVALPLKTVNTHKGGLCRFEPFSCRLSIFTDNTKFTVEKTYALFHRDRLSCYGVISAYKIWSLTTGYFEAVFINIVAPCFVLGENDRSGIYNPRMDAIGIVNLCIEDILTTKPRIIDKIVLLVAYP